jgi:4-diphosphocytidyl-2-C-methyl-D-erythritol kinase
MREMSASSPAKINLTLRVGGRRPDGFHEIESLVAIIDLADTITIRPREDDRILLTCDDPAVPCDESNLVVRAATALRSEAGRVARGVEIDIRKRVPPGAGLGGGSSNAATTLRTLNEIWELRFPLSDLRSIGAAIGSDVPLFLGDSSAIGAAPENVGPVLFPRNLLLVRGRGDEIEELRESLAAYVVLALPEFHCATARVYAAFDALPPPPARMSIRDLLEASRSRAEGAESGSPRLGLQRLSALLFNDLEPAALKVSPALARLAGELRERAGNEWFMTGSGSAYFQLCADRENAARQARSVATLVNVRTEVAAIL